MNETMEIYHKNGTVSWQSSIGCLHRLDGPAITYADGRQQWWQNDRLHRLDGPAYIALDGTQYWYQHGKRHRLDGPAVIYPDGDQHWYRHDLRHRLDGPAVIWSDGGHVWWINGIEITRRVTGWIEDNGLPLWSQWDDNIWTLFRMRFQ